MEQGASPRELALIVGLGNPGREYRSSRHNVGFRCVELLARRHGITLSERRRHATLGQGRVADHPAVLAKPRTFMNLSGGAVRYLLDRFHGRGSRLLVVVDDMDLPLGTLRLRAAGTSGGHRGLDSIIDELGSQDFARLRIGIGRPGGAVSPVGHVLGEFSAEEEPQVKEALERAAAIVEAVLTEGIEAAMNRCN